MQYSSEQYEFLFDRSEQLTEDAFERLRHKDVFRYRTKTIKSGDMLEVEVFPIWSTQGEATRARKVTTREAQRNLNDKNAKKRIIRKINTNFTENDVAITLTYADGVPDQEQARKDIQNYLRRVRSYRKKNGLPELKYVYVIEYSGDQGRTKKRVHHHVIMTGMDRDEAERLWGKGYANARRLQPDDYGFEALARYMTKEPNGGKRWCASRNLKEPTITKADTKISKRRAQSMAEDFDRAPAEIFGKLFPEYDFNDCEVATSSYVAGAYIYARMHKRKAAENKRKRGGKTCLT